MRFTITIVTILLKFPGSFFTQVFIALLYLSQPSYKIPPAIIHCIIIGSYKFNVLCLILLFVNKIFSLDKDLVFIVFNNGFLYFGLL